MGKGTGPASGHFHAGVFPLFFAEARAIRPCGFFAAPGTREAIEPRPVPPQGFALTELRTPPGAPVISSEARNYGVGYLGGCIRAAAQKARLLKSALGSEEGNNFKDTGRRALAALAKFWEAAVGPA